MKKWIYILISVLLICLGFFAYKKYEENKQYKAEREQALNAQEVYSGLHIAGQDLGGYTYEEAKAILEKDIENKLEKKITVHVEEEQLTKSFQELGLVIDYKDAFDQVVNYAKSGEDEERYQKIRSLQKKPVTYEYKVGIEDKAIENFIHDIDQGITREAIDASIEFSDGNFRIIKGENGKKLNKEKLFHDIKEALLKEEDSEITAELRVVEQAVKNEALERINGVIGTFTSNLGNGTVGRNQNVILSAKKISNRVLLPGESLSFNQEMGDITLANGYKMASTIVNGKYVDSLGGGLCQTSTTLYNALVRSDVEITERHPHSIAAPYVPVGEDGAVWVGTKDLKFTNNWDFPIVIMSEVNLKKNTISFTIYGDTNEKDYQVEMFSKVYEQIPVDVIEKESDELFQGETKVEEPGRVGMRVQSYKVYKKNGKVIKQVPYLKSYYPKKDKVILVGTKAKEAEVLPDTPEEKENMGPIDLFN